MIELTTILADLLSSFYTVRADAEIRLKENEGVGWILQRAKPLQLRLRAWYSQLPECLSLQDVTMRKLSSTGYLHLAYFAAEITLHRRIVSLLDREFDWEVVEVCQSAAMERLHKALEFVETLRPEHLQSFWYSASPYNFALIGSFISLLASRSRTAAEGESCKSNMDEYRWRLRLESKNSDTLERALELMDATAAVAMSDRVGHGSVIVLQGEERTAGDVSDGQDESETAEPGFEIEEGGALDMAERWFAGTETAFDIFN